MQPQSFLLALLASVATSAPISSSPVDLQLETRNLLAISQVLAQVDNSIALLTRATLSFSSQSANPSAFTSAATTLLNTLRTGINTVSGAQQLSLTETAQLQSLVLAFEEDAEVLVQQLVVRKAVIEQTSLCSTVGGAVQQMLAETRTLIIAMLRKVPLSVQQVASERASGIVAVLEQAEGTFAFGSCIDRNEGVPEPLPALTGVIPVFGGAPTQVFGGGGGVPTQALGGGGETQLVELPQTERSIGSFSIIPTLTTVVGQVGPTSLDGFLTVPTASGTGFAPEVGTTTTATAPLAGETGFTNVIPGSAAREMGRPSVWVGVGMMGLMALL